MAARAPLTAMPFPSAQRVIYGNPPLEEVICQLRYPPILRIAAEPPVKFQDGVRRDYPLYERGTPAHAVSAAPGIQEVLSRLGMDLSPLTEAEPHRFLTDDRTRSITLAPEFIALSDTKYPRWEDFSRELRRAEALLVESYEPAPYTRVGLRYRNAIDRARVGLPDRPWMDLLQPLLLGELADERIYGDVRQAQRVTTLALPWEGGFVTIRHGLNKRGDVERYVIDSDFYTEERKRSDECHEELSRFNSIAGSLFRWAIKDLLHDAMAPRDLDHPG